MRTYSSKLLRADQRAALKRMARDGTAKVEQKGEAVTVTYSPIQPEINMSKNGILSAMKFVAIDRVTETDPVLVRRSNMVRGIKEQIAIFDAETAGTIYKESRKVMVDQKQDDGSTKRVEIERDKRLRRHWFERDGHFYVEVRYGNRPLRVVNGQHAIDCGDVLSNVRKTFDALIRATQAGELDEHLRSIKVERKK